MNRSLDEEALWDDSLRDVLSDAALRGNLCARAAVIASESNRRRRRHGIVGLSVVALLLCGGLFLQWDPAKLGDPVTEVVTVESFVDVQTRYDLVEIVRSSSREDRVVAVRTSDYPAGVEYLLDEQLLALFADRGPALVAGPDGAVELIFSN